MTRKEIHTAVVDALADILQLTADELQPEARLEEDLLLDSLDFEELACELEDGCDVDVDAWRLRKCGTVGRVEEMLFELTR